MLAMKKVNKTYLSALVILVAMLLVFDVHLMGQAFDSKKIRQSLVRVKITGGKHASGPDKGKARGTGYASGFIWKENNHVVTSLHAMRNGDDVKVTVEWTSAPTEAEKGPFETKLIGINVEADLVLLEVQPGFVVTWFCWKSSLVLSDFLPGSH
jgi:S1-C subfamily serine protease